MSDPILVTGDDLNLYAEGKLKDMRAKIKGCVPAIVETPELPSDFDLSKMEHMQAVINKSVREGANETVRAFTANLIAAGLMEEEK